MSTTLTSELEKTYGSGKVNVAKDNTTNSYTITITGKGKYTIDANGKVEKQGPTVTYSNERIVENSDGTGTAVVAGTKTPITDKLYIYFEASVEGGTTSISPSVPFEIRENGTYQFTITSTVNGESYTTTHFISANQYAVRPGINVGDYVNYTPSVANTTYPKENLDEAHTGSTSNKSDLTQKILKWRVLKIYDDGKIDLAADMSDRSYTNTIRFGKATGYNNGVYVLHDICEKLYSNTEHNIIARSVSIEDFENNMTLEGKNTRDNFGINNEDYLQYGKTNYEKWGTPFTTYKYYPNLYANENGSGIDTENGAVKTDGIEVNEKGTLDLTTGENAYKCAETGLTARNTSYAIPINSTNFGDAWKVLSVYKDYSYWVASRCVEGVPEGITIFYLRKAINDFSVQGVFYSHDPTSNYGTGYRFRPVVQLGSDVDITPSTSASSYTGTPHTINW